LALAALQVQLGMMSSIAIRRCPDRSGRELDVSNITLTPGVILSGRVRFDSHGTPPADLTRIRLSAPLIDGT